MKLFTVYAPPDTGRRPEDDAVRMAFVKDGFCWPALFVPLPWLLWHRQWLVLLGWLAIVLAIVLAAAYVPAFEPLAGPASILFAFWFALEANGLRRWTLERRGWRFAGFATGRSRAECELGFFERWLAGAPRAAAPSPPPRPPLVSGTGRRRPGDDEVIGLFPRSE